MSSRFVSGGTIAGDSSGPPLPTAPPLAASASASASISPAPSSSTKPHAHTTANPSAPALNKLSAIPPTSPTTTTTTTNSTRSSNAEWEAAQAALAAERKQREESRRRAVEGDGAGAGGENQSLYEVLQANKAAKQAAFEEANRIRNQFRALDDDEIDFLDGVEEQRRAEEERLRSETEARLEAFRRAQRGGGGSGEGVGGLDGAEEKGEKSGVGNEAVGVGVEEVVEEWSAVGRKRKRDRERERERLVKGVKKRATEGATTATTTATREKETERVVKPAADDKEGAASINRNNAKSVDAKDGSGRTNPQGDTETAQPTNGGPAKPNLGLVDYGSDDDDDD